MCSLDPNIREVLDLVARWIHLIAGIMWVGNSMLFNWLDRNLIKRLDPEGRHLGEIWMVHSGGFYQVEKKLLAPAQTPALARLGCRSPGRLRRRAVAGVGYAKPLFDS